MSPLNLSKLKKKTSSEFKRPKKKINRFDGLSEEEVQKHTLEDYLKMNLDIVFIGINPSLMAAHRGKYYAGPGNHFYKLLYESGLIPTFVNFDEDYKLLQYGIGLTNIVARATRSAADLKRTEIKEGAKIVEEKLKLYKPKIAVFNGKCIYDVFANITNKSAFHFGLQPEQIDSTIIWVTPSSSARCANYPRLVDKLYFYTSLKKYLHFLKGEITNIDIKEFCIKGKSKQSIPSTSKMWRRKDISAFLHGGKIVNKHTLSQDTSEEDIAAVHAAEFSTQKIYHKENITDTNIFSNKDIYNKKNENQRLLNKITEKTGLNIKEKMLADNINDQVVKNSENKESFDINKRDLVSNDILRHRNNMISYTKNGKCTYPEISHKTLKTTTNHFRDNKNESLDFMSLIKQRLSQKCNADDISI